MTERLTVLRCIGCGRLDTPQACPAGCDEKAVELVFAADYDALGDVSDPNGGFRAMRELVTDLAHVDGRPAYRELQARARAALRTVDRGDPPGEVDRVPAWHCARCGSVEADQECLGICVRRPVEMVPAADYDKARTRHDSARRALAGLSPVVRRLARVTPRPGGFEATARALHGQALRALAGLGHEQTAPSTTTPSTTADGGRRGLAGAGPP